ncbi:MAG: ABC transporter permease [Oscillospiraceae bacterium]|nr:ABC transporter permease [Oscillospiraceae bacterium]
MKRKRNPYLTAGLILLSLLMLVLLIGQFWTPYDPDAMSAAEKFQPPSFRHLFGTDHFGRDIFSRILEGGGTTLTIALATVAIGAFFGTLIGAVTGYFGGLADDILMRLNDALTAFPSILLALLIISLTGPGKHNVILALGIVFIPSFARVTRTAFASLRDTNFIISARLMGASRPRILILHILPNTMRVLLPALTIGFNNAVLAEASMSFLGIGVTPPNASLGYMLAEAQGMLTRAPWYSILTGSVIVLLVFSAGLIGEGLQRKDREVA